MKRNNIIKTIVATLVGGLLGFLYYYFIGCVSGGGCPITSNPVITISTGAILGLIFSLS